MNPPLSMIPFERRMAGCFMTSDALEWQLSQQLAATSPSSGQDPVNAGLPVAERLEAAGLPRQVLPGTYRSHL